MAARRRRAVDKPELIRLGVEEFLRFESSNQLGNRITTRPVEIGGVAMPAGTFITIGIGAANRDPAEFPDPDRLDSPASPTGICRSAPVRTSAPASRRPPGGPRRHRPVPCPLPELPPGREPLPGGRARFRGFLRMPVRLA